MIDNTLTVMLYQGKRFDHHNLLTAFLVSDLTKSSGVLGPVLFIFGSAAIILLAAKMR